MGLHDFISETEAAHQAGVSVKTLRRFSDAGYLQVEIEPDGLRLYSQHELNEIFGAHRGLITSAVTGAGIESSETSCANVEVERQVASCEVQNASECISPEPEATDNPDSHRDFSSQHNPATTNETATEEQIDTSMYALEVVKLRNVITLQEKLLDTKDAEIADLKGQRDWLRARIEKLEEKSDRDQILLLSETQTIRKLISIQEQKRSPMNRLLDWLGIAPQPMVKTLGASSEYANSDTISSGDRSLEVRSASNN